MSRLIVGNFIVNESAEEVLRTVRMNLTNGKLKDIVVKSGELVITCPNPEHSGGHEANPDCNVNIKESGELPYGYFHCFACGVKGNFLKLLCLCFEKPEEWVKHWLISHFDCKQITQKIELSEPIVYNKPFITSFKNKQKKDIIDTAELNNYQSWCPYLAQRKLTRSVCERFNVKYDPKYRQVIFPCYDSSGNLIMLPKRSIDVKTFYLDKEHEKPVYCLHEIVKKNIKSAIITEGPFDTLTAWTYGFPAVGTLGTISDYQIEQINRSCLNVIYAMFDNDQAGRNFLEYIKSHLDKRFIIVDVRIPNGKKDINDLSKEEFWEILNNYL